jgi:hypothetical protein
VLVEEVRGIRAVGSEFSVMLLCRTRQFFVAEFSGMVPSGSFGNICRSVGLMTILENRQFIHRQQAS